MIFTGGHLGFFGIRYIGMTNIFISGFIRFSDPENIDVDNKIKILCQLELEILSKLDFHGAHFTHILSQLFSGEIANIIPGNEMNRALGHLCAHIG